MGQKGFLGALFDLSFSEFITGKLIKFLYILLLIVLVIGYLGVVIAGFSNSALQGLLMMFIIRLNLSYTVSYVLMFCSSHISSTYRKGIFSIISSIKVMRSLGFLVDIMTFKILFI